MPRKTKAAAAVEAALPSIPKELFDQFVTGPMSAEAVNAAAMAFKKALIEHALGAELSHHLGYPPGASKPEPATNHRNGCSAHKLKRFSLRGKRKVNTQWLLYCLVHNIGKLQRYGKFDKETDE